MANIAAGAIMTAIRDVLDDAAGNFRTITATRFDGAAYEGLDDEEKSRRGLVRPNFDITLTSLAPHGSSPPRNNSLQIYLIGVEVVVARHIGPDEKLTAASRDTAKALAITDADVVAQALEWPGNLTSDSATNATGLIGAKLMYDGSELRRFDLADNRPGLIETAHRFHGFVQCDGDAPASPPAAFSAGFTNGFY